MDVGVVESATLTDDLTHVEIKARLNSGMQKLLHNDSVFWVVKPQVGREGISGLGTLLSGAYIELQPGSKGSVPAQYPLLDSPPLASPDAKGSGFCWKAARQASCRQATRCCSAAIAWGRWKPAPLMRRNVISLISCSSMRLMTAW